MVEKMDLWWKDLFILALSCSWGVQMTFYISRTSHVGLQWSQADWMKHRCGTVLSFYFPSVSQKTIIFSRIKKDQSQAVDLICPVLLEKGYPGKILVYVHVLIHIQMYADLFQDLYSMLPVHLSRPHKRIARISPSTWRKHRCSNKDTRTWEAI